MSLRERAATSFLLSASLWACDAWAACAPRRDARSRRGVPRAGDRGGARGPEHPGDRQRTGFWIYSPRQGDAARGILTSETHCPLSPQARWLRPPHHTVRPDGNNHRDPLGSRTDAAMLELTTLYRVASMFWGEGAVGGCRMPGSLIEPERKGAGLLFGRADGVFPWWRVEVRRANRRGAGGGLPSG